MIQDVQIPSFPQTENSATLCLNEVDRDHRTLASAECPGPAEDSLAENPPPGRFVHGL